jgi:UDP-glucose 4-epimerase
MILVTGASGFIGKHLILNLIQEHGKDSVVALTSNPIQGVNSLNHNNYLFSKNYFLENGLENVEILIHAGAYTPKKNSDANDILLCNSNIFTTEKILKTKLPNLKKIILLSTLDVYGADEIITENSHIHPGSLYGFSKLYSEKIVEYWSKENCVDFQILRIGHVYGPGEEKYQKIIPVSISKILNNKPIQIYGEGNILRSFIYIDDVVKSISSSIKCDKHEGVINVVGAFAISIADLIELIEKISNLKFTVEHLPENVKDRNLIFDNSKMVKILDVIETPLYDGLVAEFNYMKSLLDK